MQVAVIELYLQVQVGRGSVSTFRGQVRLYASNRYQEKNKIHDDTSSLMFMFYSLTVINWVCFA
jgi:hypothetical protein